MSNNYRKLDLKRKVYARGKKQNFKRFKRAPKYVRDNPENKVAKEKEKDPYHFSASDESDDDLGMGIDISDLPFLDDNHEDKQKDIIALTQDSVRPFFNNNTTPQDEEEKLDEALTELKYSSFRPNQKETVKRILYGRSTLFISPTGSGKSLCYQLPALLYWRYRKCMTIVVSPLISLMEDQMSSFPSALRAVSLHSGHSVAQRRRSIEQLVNYEAQVAFISPEAIVGGVLNLEDLKNLPPVGFVCIDEAHCLSEWSHNFRPAYLQFFKILSSQLKIKTYLGLTATATRATSFAISKSLTINPETDVIGRTSIPENLILSVSYENNKERALVGLLKSKTFRIMTSIIVYCNRREETERVASIISTAMQDYSTLVEVPERTKKSLNDSTKSNDSNSSTSSDKAHMKLKWSAEPYHAGMPNDTRKRIQRQFIKGELRVVVATIAFGMGINKANVRAIIHYDMPSSFESYVQEIGRAGRDGKPAQCHMFLKADKTDVFYQQRNIYAAITERMNLKKLTEYLFKPCRCAKVATKVEMEKLEKLNQSIPHEISSRHKTSFTKTAVQSSESDDDGADADGPSDDENTLKGKENCPIRYVRKSIVRKHRPCQGHEVAFSVEEASKEINLRPESIITLICQLQQTYPQLKIEQFSPTKSTCNLHCYHGPAQLEALAKKNKAVEAALVLHKRNQIQLHGTKGDPPQKISFDVIEIASRLGKPSTDIFRMLKKTEWELVEKTGRFRRSQVRVSFEGNSFHMKAAGDLDKDEIDEINNFLFDFTRLYENVEREKIARVYNTFRRHSIAIDKMGDKDVRLDASSRLMAALNAYFDSPVEQQIPATIGESSHQLNEAKNENSESSTEAISALKQQLVRKSARAFISANGKEYTPRIIARIFQGISTPNYPAEIWGMNRLWWRIHLDVDFLQLTSIIEEELL